MNPKHLPFNDVLLFLLVGFYAGRRRWFQIAPLHRPILARVAVAAVAVAIVGVIVQEWTDIDSTIAGALVFRMTNLGVSVFYVSVITFIVSAADRTPWFLTLFAPVGMMALTNYLMQSLIMPLPFLPYTLDVHEPTTSEWAFWSLAFFFLVQVPISHWWLRHFRFGPVEWLWRSLSYASLQPMRRSDRS